MSVIMQFSMFPTDKGASASAWVSRIIAMVSASGHPYQLTSMATLVETDSLEEALQLLQKAYALLEPDCDRVYSTVTFDIRKNTSGRMHGKVQSIIEKIGPVNL